MAALLTCVVTSSRAMASKSRSDASLCTLELPVPRGRLEGRCAAVGLLETVSDDLFSQFSTVERLNVEVNDLLTSRAYREGIYMAIAPSKLTNGPHPVRTRWCSAGGIVQCTAPELAGHSMVMKHIMGSDVRYRMG